MTSCMGLNARCSKANDGSMFRIEAQNTHQAARNLYREVKLFEPGPRWVQDEVTTGLYLEFIPVTQPKG